MTAGAGLGLLAAFGCWLLLLSVRRRRLRLADRIRPYLDDPMEWSSGPVCARLVRDAAGRLGDSISVRRRLAAIGDEGAVEQFRIEQLTWSGAGLLAALLLCGFAAARGAQLSPVAVLLLAAVAMAGGALGRDRLLSAQVARHNELVLAELPAVAELLALSVGAGEGVAGALERVCRTARGELADELRRTLADARAGTPVVAALTRMAGRSSLPALARFVDGVAVAVERGTPLADVLRAQAGDVREERRRALLATGGRKEIAMLFPVVFLVLPVTVVFALYPGFANLSLAVS